MKKGFIHLMCIVLIFAVLTPLSATAQQPEVSFKMEGEEITFIKDTDEESIYRIKENGKTIEYHEKVKENKNKTTIHVKVYEVQDGKKNLIDNFKNELITVSDTVFIFTDDTGNAHSLNLNNDKKFEKIDADVILREPGFSTLGVRYVTKSGGSLVADTRYRIFSDGSSEAIMAGENPYYKNTRKKNSNFIDFTHYADGLKSDELDLITFGIAGFADDLIKALRGGKLLSWSLIKKIVGTAVKVGPFGAALTLFSYGKNYTKAQKAYRAI
ncbi:hypothetical protein [Fredinandcohnia quinoae]|uniref:Uncharacterized protein n=1 Tax=Fredinandcohnia quinoae TaxID=2918902 RepID=A0AAW5EE18_9BACI|nr:hypothetical protein [Fredinandcohnia sp. SECRCQ15]MCH1627716.1 hypothetical protein [Fredinandcohnia sp. SECRCQ15]